MGLFDFVGDFLGINKDIKTTPVALYSPEQEALLKKITDAIMPYIGKSATEFSGETFAEAPEQFGQAIKSYADTKGNFSEQLTSAIQDQLSGVPSFTYDPAQITDLWQKGFASPLMQVFQDETVPMIREEFAGGLFSTQVGKTIGRESTNLMKSVIAPGLFGAQLAGQQMGFQAGETAKARQTGAIQTAANLPAVQFQQDMMVSQAIQQENQSKLLDAYQRFMRLTPEQSPWLQLGMQASGLGSQARYDNIAEPGRDVWDVVSQVAGPALLAGAVYYG